MIKKQRQSVIIIKSKILIIIIFNKSHPSTALIDKKIEINKINLYFYSIYVFNNKKNSERLFNNKKLIFFIEPNTNVIKKNNYIIKTPFEAFINNVKNQVFPLLKESNTINYNNETD